ncbi:MAG: cupin domain-containing protein [Gemmatimonadaceae bacterium]|jgi:quercetin dioxygenase-like cupin family protein
MSTDDRLREHPKERLAAPVQRIDLQQAAALLGAEPHAPNAGHRQVALVRRGPFSLILFLFEPGGSLKEHRTEGEVTIHVLSGRLEVTAAGESHEVAGGGVMALAPGEAHAVHALEASEMLLTVCRTAT